MLSDPVRTGAVVALSAVLLLPAAPASAATPQAPPTPAAAREAERQADLVAGEDQRLTEALVAGLDPKHLNRTRHAYRVRSAGLFTLVLTRRRAPYTFDDLRRLASDTLVPQSKGTFLLRENIVVAEGATLNVSAAQPLRIRMSSGPEGFVSLVTLGGRLRLNGTASAPISLQSWDESKGRADTDVSDGRAYVRASGQLVVRHTSFSRLGFWSGRTGGVSVVGSGTTPVKDIETGTVSAAGDDPVAEHGSKADLLPAGRLPSAAANPDVSYGTTISDATMTGNTFGLFVTGSSGTVVTDTVIRKSLVDGLVLHRDVDSATVRNVRVERSGQDGVVVTRKVEGTLLSRVSALRNGRDGVVLAGKPLADGPSASGSSTRPFGNNVLTASTSTDNGRIGIHVIGGAAVRVQGNTVHGGRSGIVVSDGAGDVDVDSNRVDGAHANGIQVRESGAVTVTGNVVRNSPTGIHVRNSAATIKQNSTSGVTLHGITFVGTVNGSVAKDNLLSGSGTSAVDVVRAGEHQAPDVAGNDVSGWSRTVTSDSLLSLLLHPLTVIWIFVAVALVAMSRPRRGAPGLPYRADPLAPGSGAGPRPVPSPALAPEPRMEPVPVAAFRRPRITPNLAAASFDLELPLTANRPGSTVVVVASDEAGEVARVRVRADLDLAPRIALALPEGRVRTWSPEDPFLYDLRFELRDADDALLDALDSYAGLRSVAIRGKAITLNGTTVFQRLVLDQGYYPESLMTAPSDADLVRDIELGLAAGFNGARLHQKVFEERYLHHADRLGYLVWGEFGDWGCITEGPADDRQQPDAAYVAEWLEVLERDHSHPSIVGWCPLNETPQHIGDRITALDDVTRAMFLATKAHDTSRPVLDASGYSHRVIESDVYDSHDYEQDPTRFAANHTGLAQGSPRVNRDDDRDETWSIPYAGQPYFVSEFGGIWWNPDEIGRPQSAEQSWGYGERVRDVEEFHRRFDGLVGVLLDDPGMFGYCYTQLTDVFQEENGVYRFDRTEKFATERIRAAQVRPAAIEPIDEDHPR